jgi:hypothetical protein
LTTLSAGMIAAVSSIFISSLTSSLVAVLGAAGKFDEL